MSLNIIPNNTLTSISNQQALNLRSGYENLRSNRSTQIESSGIKVDFSANYNSNLTAYFATGSISNLIKGLKVDRNVHALDPHRTHALV